MAQAADSRDSVVTWARRKAVMTMIGRRRPPETSSAAGYVCTPPQQQGACPERRDADDELGHGTQVWGDIAEGEDDKSERSDEEQQHAQVGKPVDREVRADRLARPSPPPTEGRAAPGQRWGCALGGGGARSGDRRRCRSEGVGTASSGDGLRSGRGQSGRWGSRRRHSGPDGGRGPRDRERPLRPRCCAGLGHELVQQRCERSIGLGGHRPLRPGFGQEDSVDELEVLQVNVAQRSAQRPQIGGRSGPIRDPLSPLVAGPEPERGTTHAGRRTNRQVARPSGCRPQGKGVAAPEPHQGNKVPAPSSNPQGPPREPGLPQPRARSVRLGPAALPATRRCRPGPASAPRPGRDSRAASDAPARPAPHR
jgi:hypothetical protein